MEAGRQAELPLLQPGPSAQAGRPMAAQAASDAPRRLRLHAVELEGFKSYRERALVGAPFGRFTAVVGPNGCGKSVVGEAIAFALGGNARMMRARNLGSLVNHTESAAGVEGAAGAAAAAPVAAAEVIIHFEILGQGRQPEQEEEQGEGGGSREGDSWGRNGVRPKESGAEEVPPAVGPCGSCAAAASSAAAEVAGRLLIRRRVSRNGRSDLSVQHLPARTDAVAGTAAVGCASSGGGDIAPGAGHWQSTTPAALRKLLAPFGIQTEAVDRFVVTQHRQAVQVAEPVQLARFLELLIGTASYGERLAAVEAEAGQQAAAYDCEEERLAELQLQRQRLAPEVAKWRRYEEHKLQYGVRKRVVLGQQAGLLERQLAEQQCQVASVEAEVATHAAEQASAKSAADDLLERRAAASKALKAAEKGHARLAKRVAAAQMEAAKLKVQLKAAEAAAAGGAGAKAGVQQQVQKRLAQAEREAGQHREALTAATAVLAELREDEALVSAKVGKLRAELAAPGGLSSLAAELAAAQHAAEAARSSHGSAQQWLEQCVARAAAAEAEQIAAAAAAAQRQERQAEAAGKVEVLKGQQQQRLPQLQAAEARLQAARQQQYQRAAAAAEVQAGLSSVSAQIAEAERPPTARVHGQAGAAAVGGSEKQTADQAVAAIATSCPPGTFHGRLHSVARLAPGASAGAGTAVNAALLELCNPRSYLVVATREAAQQVVSHFEAHRVGVATCKILAELQSGGGGAHTHFPASGGGGGGGDGLTPLVSCVQPNPAVPGAEVFLAGHLLANWWLAADRQAALAAVQVDKRRGGRRRNVVTAQGDVFKADGEIVGARSPPSHLRPYLLSHAFVAPNQQASTLAGAPPAGQAAEPDLPQLRQQAAVLQEQAQQAQQAAADAAQQAEAAAAVAGKLQEEQQAGAVQLAAAERRVAQLQEGIRAKGGRTVQQQAQQLQRQVQEGQRQAAVAKVAATTTAAQLAQAEQRLAAVWAAHDACMSRSTSGAALLAAERDLQALQVQAGQAEQQVAASTAALTAAARQQLNLQAAKRAQQAAAAQAAELREKVEGLEEAAQQQGVEAEGLAAAAEQHRKECTSIEADWRAAVKRHEAATRRWQQQLAALRALTSAQQQRRRELEVVRAALTSAGPPEEHQQEVAADAAPGDAEGTGTHAATTGAIQHGRSEVGSEGESEEEQPRRRRRRVTRAESRGSLPVAAGTSSAAAGLSGAIPSRSKRRQAVVESSEGDSSEEDGSAGEVAHVAARSASASARDSKRAALATSHRKGAASWSRPGRHATSHGSVSEEGSDSDFEARPPAHRRASTAGASTAGATRSRAQQAQQGRQQQHHQQQQRRQRRRSAVPAGDGEEAGGSCWNSEAVQAALEELAQQEQQVQALQASLAPAALQEDAAAAAQQEEGGRKLDSLADALAELERQQGSLQEERYARFHSSLTAVNAQLSPVYARLTGGQGDAYCSYTPDRLAAFTDGVTFHVRPDRQRWRPFPSLSGGQQALATLALCFALQAAAPSPFYFFDEVDCALDTVNAARVADYISAQQAQHGAQYLVVSHKPQVYERAGCLVGVTSRHHASEAVTVHMGTWQG